MRDTTIINLLNSNRICFIELKYDVGHSQNMNGVRIIFAEYQDHIRIRFFLVSFVKTGKTVPNCVKVGFDSFVCVRQGCFFNFGNFLEMDLVFWKVRF